ncbi:aprataxin [Kwoniella heveanensis BCC8398]|uniref:Aprataxin n=1 Tax=Kwoniella heveanensis BCC8398 TaxID=1296120 RepID=A0A1B9GPN3_9TREE|nr:aprataxin [Kwoniella heveanensis BCC8398]
MGNCMSPVNHSRPNSPVTAPASAALNEPTSSSATNQTGPTGLGDPNQRRTDRKGKDRASSTEDRPVGRLHSRKRSSMSGSSVLYNLRRYATTPNPTANLPPSLLLLSSPNAIAIFDAYPKAKYHFLVMPRHPFPPQSDPESRSSITSLESLEDLKSVLMKCSREVREEVLTAMANMAREVEEMIRDEMLKTEGFEWKIDVGFHAIPSMKHIHLHVISDDRIGSGLKKKHHHNSFRPDLGFFVPIMEVQRWIEDDSNMQERVDALSGAERLLHTPLTCHKCDEFMANMPKLKTHLEKHFKEEKEAALKHIAKHGRQRSSDEEIF